MRCVVCVWGRNMKRLLNEWIVSGLIIGLLGGIARAMHCLEHEFSWMRFAYRVIAASFVSAIAGLIMAHMDYPPTLEAAIIGASGYAAVDILQCVPDVVKSRAERLK